MKLVTAIIKPFKLEDVKGAPAGRGVHGLTVPEAPGSGRQKGPTEANRGAGNPVDLAPKVRSEADVGVAAVPVSYPPLTLPTTYSW